MAAGPKIATNRDGNMKKIRGKSNFIGILAAISSARCILWTLMVSEYTFKD
jgi:hypothetical protein